MQPATRKKPVRSAYIYVLCFLVLLLFPHTVWAVQQHGGAEGLVSHQIGHFLFICGMLWLLYRINPATHTGPGWFEFKLFIWLIISWNFLTFYGHWHQELIDPAKLIRVDGKTTGFVISTPLDILFYFSRLDHLLLLPAFLSLLTALAKWRKHA